MLVRPGRERLSGIVEVDETFVGGEEPGLRGGEDPSELLPLVHRVASLAKRWLLGPHQGAADAAHLPGYLDKFVFCFNRRHSRSCGMVLYRVLELAVDHGPVRYHDVLASSRPRDEPPDPPFTRDHPPSLDRAPANRPWRTRTHTQVKWRPRISITALVESVPERS